MDLLYYSDRASLPSGMYSIGRRLREERLRKGLKIQDVAEQTRIRAVFLEALEEDRFDVLPGRFFARSFLRQYARLLGIEDTELEAEITRQLADPEGPASAQAILRQLAAAAPPKRSWLGRTRLAARPVAYGTAGLAAVAAVLGLYLGWRQLGAGQERRSLSEANPPASVEPPAPLPKPAVSENAPAAAQVPASEALSRMPESAAPQAATIPTSSPLVVDVSAARASWIQVTGDGKILFSDTLQPGQSRTFRAAQVILIKTGNAGALEIRRNGQPIGPVGPEGQVRTIELTPEGHTISAPAPKPATPELEPPV